MERIVVPSGMLLPVTVISTCRPPVSAAVRPVTVVEPATVLPLSSIAEKSSDCVRWAVVGAESVTDVGVVLRIVVLSGMPGPVTGIPGSRVVVDEMPEISVVPAVEEPVRFCTPAPKVSAELPAAVAFAEIVSDVVSAGLMLRMVALAGMPVPVTGIPTSSPSVEEIPVISGLPLIVVPLEARAAVPNAKDEVITEATLADSVMLVPLLIDRIVVPTGMPEPLTPIPSLRPEVVASLVTVGVPATTVPVSVAVSSPAVTSRWLPLDTKNVVHLLSTRLRLRVVALSNPGLSAIRILPPSPPPPIFCR